MNTIRLFMDAYGSKRIGRAAARGLSVYCSAILALTTLSAQTSFQRPDVQWQLPGTMYGATDRRELVISPSGQLLAYYHTHDAGLGLRGYISVWKPTGDATFSLVTTLQPSFQWNYSFYTAYSGPRVAFAGENNLVAADGSIPNNGVDYFSIDPSAPESKRYRRLATYTESGVTHTAVAAVSSTRFVAAAIKGSNAVVRLYEYDDTDETIKLRDEELLGIGEATCVDVTFVGNAPKALVGTDSGAIFLLDVVGNNLTVGSRHAAPSHVTRIKGYISQGGGGLRFVAGTIDGEVFNGTVVYVERTQDPVYDLDIIHGNQYCWVSFGKRSVRLDLNNLAYAGAMEYPAFQRHYPRACLQRTSPEAPLSFAMAPDTAAAYTIPVANVPSIARINLSNNSWEVMPTLGTPFIIPHGAQAVDSVYFVGRNGPRWHFLAATGSTGQDITIVRVSDSATLQHGLDTYGTLVLSTVKDIAYLEPVVDGDTIAYLALQNGIVQELKNEYFNNGQINVGGELQSIAVARRDDEVRLAVGRSLDPDTPQVLIYTRGTNWTLQSTIDLSSFGLTGFTIRDLEFNPANPDQLCVYATYRGSFGAIVGWVALYDLSDIADPRRIASRIFNTSGTPRANSIAYSPYGEKIALPSSFDLLASTATLFSTPDLAPITYNLMRPLIPDLSYVYWPPYVNSVSFLNSDQLVVGMVGDSRNIFTPAHGHLVGVIQLQGDTGYWQKLQSQHMAAVTGVTCTNGLAASVSDDGTMRVYNFNRFNGAVAYEYNPPNFKGTLDLEPTTLEVAGGGHFIKGRGVLNNPTPFAPVMNLTEDCAAHTAWISGGFNANGRLWHITPSELRVIDGLGATKQSVPLTTTNYEPAVYPYVNVATEGNQALICALNVSNQSPPNRLYFALYDQGSNTITTQSLLNPSSYFHSNAHLGDAVTISTDGNYALFVGYRPEVINGNLNYSPLLALLRKQGGSWALITETFSASYPSFYSGALLPRGANQSPLVVATGANGTAYVFDPDNNWAIVQTIANISPISADYRDGFVVIGGRDTLRVYAYDPNNLSQPLSERRVYNLEAWPGVVKLKMGNYDAQEQRIPIAYTRANGDLTFAYVSTTPSVACGCEDINADGIVDDGDLLIVLFGFGATGSPGGALYSQGDINCDGVVDDADLLMVLFAFGGPC